MALLLSDAVYNFLSNGAKIVLPAIGALYFALSQIWPLPYAGQISGTVAALNVFFGAIAVLAKRSYNAQGGQFDGTMVIENTESGSTLRLQSVDIQALATKSSVSFKVVQPPNS